MTNDIVSAYLLPTIINIKNCKTTNFTIFISHRIRVKKVFGKEIPLRKESFSYVNSYIYNDKVNYW